MNADEIQSNCEPGRPGGADRSGRRPRSGEPPARGQPTEKGGPKGPEPTRYGDWERKGIASDF